MFNAQVVQTHGDYDREIRETVFSVAQNIFHDTRAFDAGYDMFNADTDSRDALILLFLGVSQFSLARLFFGWYV